MQHMIGRKFNRWTVLEIVSAGAIGKCKCRCDCGVEKLVTTRYLLNGQSASCGCLRKEVSRSIRLKHGMAESAEYRIWTGMKTRCTNPNTPNFALYGGAGIKVCRRWQKFQNFLADMGQRPSPAHSIHRKNGRKGYEPSNCIWATPTEQANATSSNKLVTFDGRTETLAWWVKFTGVRTLGYRLRNGWSVEDALSSASAPRRSSAARKLWRERKRLKSLR